jgi:hypothetical protein
MPQVKTINLDQKLLYQVKVKKINSIQEKNK